MELLRFPVEILIFVLQELSVQDLHVCMQTCRTLFALIQSTTSLQYQIELLAVGMRNRVSSGLHTAKKLAMLKQHQNLWRRLQLSETWSVPCNGSWTISGDIIGNASSTGALNLYQIPSELFRLEERKWQMQYDPSEMSIAIFEIDIVQDLIIFAEKADVFFGDLYPRALSQPTSPHPLASKPRLSCSATFSANDSCALYIQSDVVGWLISDPMRCRSQLKLWNWKTGHELLSIINLFPEPYLMSFAFLDDRHIIASDFARLVVQTFDSQTPIRAGDRSKSEQCSFFLPELGPDAMYLRTSVCARNCGISQVPSTSQVPFQPLDAHSLFMVAAHASTFHEAGETFVILVAASSIMSHVTSAREGSQTSFDWLSWGPADTRTIRLPRADIEFFLDIRGSKGMLAYYLDAGDRTLHVDVYDINPVMLFKEARQIPEEAYGSVIYVTTPSSIQAPEYFHEEITTNLPYRLSKSHLDTVLSSHEQEERGLFVDVLMTEDGIVVITAEERIQFYSLT